jgi:cystathionine beta-lyase
VRLGAAKSPVRRRLAATKWAPGGPALRLHIGLEDVGDLKADLARGFEALRMAR